MTVVAGIFGLAAGWIIGTWLFGDWPKPPQILRKARR